MDNNFKCDWCGSSGAVIANQYGIGENSFMGLLKCSNCHHEWQSVITIEEVKTFPNQR